MRHPLEYALFRSVQSAARILGPDRAYRIGSMIGAAGFRILPNRRRLSRENVWRALPALRRGTGIEETAAGAFEHFSGSVMESMGSAGRRPRVSFENLKVAADALSRGRGIVSVIAHLGNWEVAGMAAARLPIPIVSVARPVHNPVLDAYFDRARARTGQRIVGNRGTIHRLTRIVADNVMLIIPCDQWPKRGVTVEFLGRPTLFLRTPAVLALRTGAPIIPINIFREPGPRSSHRVVLTAPIVPTGREADPVQAITQRIAARLESFIREHPEQWMWMHDRWKPVPESTAALARAA